MASAFAPCSRLLLQTVSWVFPLGSHNLPTSHSNALFSAATHIFVLSRAFSPRLIALVAATQILSTLFFSLTLAPPVLHVSPMSHSTPSHHLVVMASAFAPC